MHKPEKERIKLINHYSVILCLWILFGVVVVVFCCCCFVVFCFVLFCFLLFLVCFSHLGGGEGVVAEAAQAVKPNMAGRCWACAK